MEVMLEMSAALADGPAVIELSTPLSPGRPVPAGIQIGSLMYLPELRGVDFSRGEMMNGYEQQIRQALRNAELTLEHAGATLDNVAHVTVYVAELDQGHEALNKIWPEFFPDASDRPPHKYLPASLPDGVLAQAHVTAVRGSRRAVLEIPGMKHSDPMSMGARIGSMIFSSRVVGTDTKTGSMPEAPAEQAKRAFENVEKLLEQAGASPADLVQVTAFVPDAKNRKAAEAAFIERFPKGSPAPKLNVLQVDLPAGATVRLEITASLPD